MYAFVKMDREISLAFYGGCTLDELSGALIDNGVIKNPDVFKLYVKFKDKERVVENFSGELKLNTSMSYREILSELS